VSAPVQSLADWLAIATGKLCLPAQERIKLELTSHFEDSLAAYHDKGIAEPEALARALADLGDAEKAARNFKKRHLTQSEAEFLGKKLSLYQKSAGSFWRQALFWLILCFIFGFEYHRLTTMHRPTLIPMVSIVLALMLSQASIWAARRESTRSLRFVLTLNILSWMAMLIFMGTVDLFSVPILILINFKRKSIRFSLWFKVIKIGDVSKELHPPDAIAS